MTNAAATTTEGKRIGIGVEIGLRLKLGLGLGAAVDAGQPAAVNERTFPATSPTSSVIMS